MSIKVSALLNIKGDLLLLQYLFNNTVKINKPKLINKYQSKINNLTLSNNIDSININFV